MAEPLDGEVCLNIHHSCDDAVPFTVTTGSAITYLYRHGRRMMLLYCTIQMTGRSMRTAGWEPGCLMSILHLRSGIRSLTSLYNIIKWWMERGIAGFRIDAIIDIKKALPFRDYAAGRDDGLCDISDMLENAEGIGEFLGEMRGA